MYIMYVQNVNIHGLNVKIDLTLNNKQYVR